MRSVTDRCESLTALYRKLFGMPFMKTLLILWLSLWSLASATAPVVFNIRASQRPGTKLVDIYYDLADADGDLQLIQVAVSSDAGLTYGIPCVTLSGQFGAGISPGTNRKITWNAGADWSGNWMPQCRVRITAHDGTTPPAPPGMAYIPGGPFQMGDNLDGMTNALPVHNVQVDAFFMDKYEVTKELWQSVQIWGNNNGYSICAGNFKSAMHPVHSVSWYDVLKWCNARSEKEGLTPCYYTDPDQKVIYKNGIGDIDNTMVKWGANGYRLPTEAEWEKAARGGATGQRYPWGNNIAPPFANYSTSGNPWITGDPPYTSSVGSYPANDYGLFDMAGNVWEWIWDCYSRTYYSTPESLTNPPGPASGATRVLRGGYWYFDSSFCRVANRYSNTSPASMFNSIGFRSVRR